MARRYQICCIKRTDRLNHHERIRYLGGVNPDGAHWRLSEAAMIEAIESGRWSFYVSRAGRDLDIVIVTSKYGRKYIKTAADGLHPESLLALPECA